MTKLLTLAEKREFARKLAREKAERRLSPSQRKMLVISAVITAINITLAIACYAISL